MNALAPRTAVSVPRAWLLGELRLLGLRPSDIVLFLTLWALTRDGDGITTEASVATMANAVGQTRETVSRGLTRLAEAEFITRERRHGQTALTRINLDSITARTAEVRRFQAKA